MSVRILKLLVQFLWLFLLFEFFRIGTQYETYMKSLSSVELVTIDDKNMTDALLKRAAKSIAEFKYHDLTAVEFESDKQIIVWYNSMAYHSAPLSLSYLHNAMVKSTLGDEYSIHVINAPLPRQTKELGFFETASAILLANFYLIYFFIFAIIIYFIMALYSPSYLTFYIAVCIHSEIYLIKTSFYVFGNDFNAK